MNMNMKIDMATILSAENEMTQKLTSLLQKTILPIGKETFFKMAWMEIWRSVWLHSFRFLRGRYQVWTGCKYYDSVWERYAPGWLRRGVRSVVVKKVQGGLQGVVYRWITRGWEVVSIGFGGGGGSGWLDFEVVGDGDGDGDIGDGNGGGGQGGLDEMELELEFENGADLSEGEGEGSGMDDCVMDDDVDMDMDMDVDIE